MDAAGRDQKWVNPAGIGSVAASLFTRIAGDAVSSPIRVTGTPRACRMTVRSRPPARGAAPRTAARSRRRRRGRLAPGRVPADSNQRRAAAGMGRAAASITAPVPLACASWLTASARPSLRSMQALADRVRPSSAPTRSRGSGRRCRSMQRRQRPHPPGPGPPARSIPGRRPPRRRRRSRRARPRLSRPRGSGPGGGARGRPP